MSKQDKFLNHGSGKGSRIITAYRAKRYCTISIFAVFVQLDLVMLNDFNKHARPCHFGCFCNRGGGAVGLIRDSAPINFRLRPMQNANARPDPY
ncbi:MAG: hypothetical protein M0Q01_02695, partial [Syntrophales bacterium]|nr:hypothetical protein [Syntrophales bacterium]